MHRTTFPLPPSHSALSALEWLVTVAAESGFYRCNLQPYIRVTVAGAEYCQPRFQTQVHSTDMRQGQLGTIDVWIKQHNFDGPDHDASFIHIHSEIQKWRILFIYSREDEIRDAGDKRCTGHGWASIRRVSLKIYGVLFMQWLTSAFKGKEPRGLTQRGKDTEGWRRGWRVIKYHSCGW